MAVKKSQDQTSSSGAMLLRLPELRRKWPRCKTTIYADIADGVFPPPVHLGERCSAWIEGEVDQVCAARIAGASEAQIRELVKRLVAERRAGLRR
jgi:prophage regulatory protein